MKARSIVLVAGLLVSAVLAATQVFGNSEQVAEPILRTNRTTVAATNSQQSASLARAATADGVAFLEDRTKLMSNGNTDAPTSFFGQPRKSIEVTPPAHSNSPGEAAPPLPFSFLGRATVDGQERVFLSDGTSTYVVAPGNHVSDDYVLKSFDGSILTFTYSPLHLDQTLSIE